MQRELKQLPTHDPKRAALIAASDRCERIGAASRRSAAAQDLKQRELYVVRVRGHIASRLSLPLVVVNYVLVILPPREW
jgi:hypothetical protein